MVTSRQHPYQVQLILKAKQLKTDHSFLFSSIASLFFRKCCRQNHTFSTNFLGFSLTVLSHACFSFEDSNFLMNSFLYCLSLSWISWSSGKHPTQWCHEEASLGHGRVSHCNLQLSLLPTLPHGIPASCTVSKPESLLPAVCGASHIDNWYLWTLVCSSTLHETS